MAPRMSIDLAAACASCGLSFFLFRKMPQLAGEKEQREQYDDHRTELKRERSAGPFGQKSGLHAAELPQSRRGKAINSHHPSAIRVRHGQLYERIEESVED